MNPSRQITSVQRTKLHKNLIAYFSLEELKTLCFDLGVDYDNLPGEGKASKARELLSYLERVGRIPQLISSCSEERPLVNWEDILNSESNQSQKTNVPKADEKDPRFAQQANLATSNLELLAANLYRIYTLIGDLNRTAKTRYLQLEALGEPGISNVNSAWKIMYKAGNEVKNLAEELKIQTLLLPKVTHAYYQAASIAIDNWPKDDLNRALLLWIMTNIDRLIQEMVKREEFVRKSKEGLATWTDGPPKFVKGAKRAAVILDRLYTELQNSRKVQIEIRNKMLLQIVGHNKT